MSGSIPFPSTASSEKSSTRSFASSGVLDVIGRRALWPLSLLLGTFAWFFVYGSILGIAPFAAGVTAPLGLVRIGLTCVRSRPASGG
jgi:hypothetical protein